jgi:hypothetical protein
MATKDLFCAKDQLVTAHEGAVDSNGEFIFTCTTPECGRFVKFPADYDASKIEEGFTVHEEANTGQVSLEGQFKVLDEVMGTTETPAEGEAPAEPVAPAAPAEPEIPAEPEAPVAPQE